MDPGWKRPQKPLLKVHESIPIAKQGIKAFLIYRLKTALFAFKRKNAAIDYQ
jgi:hypothetical protein